MLALFDYTISIAYVGCIMLIGKCIGREYSKSSVHLCVQLSATDHYFWRHDGGHKYSVIPRIKDATLASNRTLDAHLGLIILYVPMLGFKFIDHF
jgi:hypothetical protein